MTEVTLWKKGTFDGKHKASTGNVKQAILIEAATAFIGSLPDPDESLSTKEVAKMLPLKTLQDVALTANKKADLSSKILEDWQKQDAKRRTNAKKMAKRERVEYAIQHDSLMPARQPKKRTKPALSPAYIESEDKQGSSGFSFFCAHSL